MIGTTLVVLTALVVALFGGSILQRDVPREGRPQVPNRPPHPTNSKHIHWPLGSTLYE
jgi:hypothetical protein